MNWIALIIFIVLLGISIRPLGIYMGRMLISETDWKVEQWIYKIARPKIGHNTYIIDFITFSLISLIYFYLLCRFFDHRINSAIDFNYAISFVTNTNFQTSGNPYHQIVEIFAIIFQCFVSPAVGISVASYFMKSFNNYNTSFTKDIIRCIVRVLLPISFVVAIILVAAGSIENFHSPLQYINISGQHAIIPNGQIAAHSSIKELGNNGGSLLSNNAISPLESPNSIINIVRMYLMLLIPLSLPFTFGIITGYKKNGYIILYTMLTIIVISTTALVLVTHSNVNWRFGHIPSMLYSSFATLTGDGSNNIDLDTLKPLAIIIPMFNMLIGEIAPGGPGVGLLGMIMVFLLSVFLSGLMIGRTPEYLNKKISIKEIRYIALYMLLSPLLFTIGLSILLLHKGGITQYYTHLHSMSDLIYNVSSLVQNNGSAMSGIDMSSDYFNIIAGILMLCGRFLPILFIILLANSFRKQKVNTTVALKTDTLGFATITLFVVYTVVAITYLPFFIIGPISDYLK